MWKFVHLSIQVQPESTVVIEWATILDGSELVHDVWDENTTCFFSGCYETASFSTFWIQSANCTLPRKCVSVGQCPLVLGNSKANALFSVRCLKYICFGLFAYQTHTLLSAGSFI